MAEKSNDLHLNYMITLVDDFISGHLDLHSFSAGLETSIAALRGVSEEWKQQIIREWGIIEDARSYFEFRGENRVDIDTQKRILNAARRIKEFIYSPIGPN